MKTLRYGLTAVLIALSLNMTAMTAAKHAIGNDSSVILCTDPRGCGGG